jgi:hypothetical protein
MVTENVGVAQLASEFGLCNYTLIYRDRHVHGPDHFTSLVEYCMGFLRAIFARVLPLHNANG